VASPCLFLVGIVDAVFRLGKAFSKRSGCDRSGTQRGLAPHPPPPKILKSTTSTLLADTSPSLHPAVVSASEANRSFSTLLRQVALGQRFTVLSHGRSGTTIAPAAESTASLGVSRRALLTRLATQPASGESRSWQRDDLYD